jgi:homoserine O-acetyltransferase
MPVGHTARHRNREKGDQGEDAKGRAARACDYNPSVGLERIQAALLAINSADDERNPPETGIMDRGLKRVKNGKLLLIPASADTRGHGTTGMARFWRSELQLFLASVPKRAM